MGRVLDVLAAITTLLQKLLAKAAARRAQKDADELAADPAGWYTDHFGGVSDHADTAAETDVDDHPNR
jgi:hypothetical protein